jgi:glycosyltransferase involved in cell wall biosynthesis
MTENGMRIAMVAHTPYWTDPRVQRAAEALAESGHRVDLFALDKTGGKVGEANALISFHLMNMRKQRAGAARRAFEYGSFFAWALALISIRHARRRYDVVYVHNMPNFLVIAGLLPKLTGARIVLDVHDPAVELLACVRGPDLPLWQRRLAVAEERASIALCDALITVNESMRRRLAVMTRRPVTVVMNLTDPAELPAPGTLRGRDAEPWIVYCGSVAHRHGVDLTVTALSLLASEFPSLRFRIIGGGSASESLKQLAAELGVADRVEFSGDVPHDQVPALLAGAAAGISSQREDVFGSLVFSMKVSEYVALGLPVICSRIATMQYYFAADELLYFEPGNAEDLARAIRELLADPAAAAERAARSQIRLGKLDWPAQKQALVAAVESAAGRGRPPAPPEPALAGPPAKRTRR